MTTNNNKTDTHIYNIINNPPKEFIEPCECCGVSEFQLGVKHAEERIIKLLETEIERFEHEDFYAVGVTNGLIKLIKGETNEWKNN